VTDKPEYQAVVERTTTPAFELEVGDGAWEEFPERTELKITGWTRIGFREIEA
jgi:hypothetical protein